MQDPQKLADDIAKVVQLAVGSSNTQRDNQIAQMVTASISKIDWNQKPEPDEVLGAMFSILGEIAKKTPTKVDDKVLKFAESLATIYGLDQQAPTLIDRIKDRIRQRRAKKA